MKKKIFLLSLLLALGAVSYSAVDLSNEAERKEAEKILENARKRIMKEDKERAKAMEEEKARAEEEARQKALAEEEMKKMQEATMTEKVESGELSSDREAQEKAMEAARERNENMAVEGVAGATAINDKEKLVAEYLKEKERLAREEKKNLKTPMEKLEYTRKQALEKVDFYERVVRSVAREEADIKSFKEILNTDI